MKKLFERTSIFHISCGYIYQQFQTEQKNAISDYIQIFQEERYFIDYWLKLSPIRFSISHNFFIQNYFYIINCYYCLIKEVATSKDKNTVNYNDLYTMFRKNKKGIAPNESLTKHQLCKQLEFDPQNLALLNNYAINLSNQKKQVKLLIHDLIEENDNNEKLKNKRNSYQIRQQFPFGVETALNEPCYLLWGLTFPEPNNIQQMKTQVEAIKAMMRPLALKQSEVNAKSISKTDNSEVKLFLLHIEQRRKFLREILSKRLAMIEQKIVEEEQQEKRKPAILKFMEKNIVDMERFIFLDTITAIEEIPQTNKIKVYFEQSYSSKIMDKTILQSIIGIIQYLFLRDQALKYDKMLRYQQQQFYVSCHYCRQVIQFKSDIFQCKMKLTTQSLLSTPYTNPQIFYRIFLDPYNNRTYVSPQDQYYCHPYLRYWHFYRIKNTDQLVPICNKVYCSECYHKLRKKFYYEMSIKKNETKKSATKKSQKNRKRVKKLNESKISTISNKKIKPTQQSYCCLYCGGYCNCRRCIKGQQLISSMAYYQLYGGNMHQLKKYFVFPTCQNQYIIQRPNLSQNIIKEAYHEQKKKVKIRASDKNLFRKKLTNLGQIQTCKRQNFEQDFYNLPEQCDILERGYKMKNQLWDMSQRVKASFKSQQSQKFRQTARQRRENQLSGQRTILEDQMEQEEQNVESQISGEQDQQKLAIIQSQNIHRVPIYDDGQGAPLGMIYNRYNQEDVSSQEFSADSSRSDFQQV